jgi:hypothetical protein
MILNIILAYRREKIKPAFSNPPPCAKMKSYQTDFRRLPAHPPKKYVGDEILGKK